MEEQNSAVWFGLTSRKRFVVFPFAVHFSSASASIAAGVKNMCDQEKVSENGGFMFAE